MSATDTRPALPQPVVPPPAAVPERVKSPTRSVVELVAAVGLIVLVAVVAGLTDLLIVIACIVVMIMVHELGHLLAAKRGGMKVTEYFLGFGPRLWSFRRGETEYGIKDFPLVG